MRLALYRDRTFRTVPADLFWNFDGEDDRFMAAFENYSDPTMDVIAAWGTTGEEKDRPSAVIVVTHDHIITGYIDLLVGNEDEPPDDWNEAEEGPWPGYDEPTARERLIQMLAYYRLETGAPYLIVHDADWPPSWEEVGFVSLPPLDHVPPNQALHVLTWGTPPHPLYDFLRQRGLPWARNVHRGFVP